MSTDVINLLIEEQKQWLRYPIPGCFAGPSQNEDGTKNWMVWNCVVSGMKSTPWEHGRFPVRLYYNNLYPGSLPLVRFESNIFHPNIGPTRYLKIPSQVLEPTFLAPKMDVRMILLAIQHILVYPDQSLSARVNKKALYLYQTNRPHYNYRVAYVANKHAVTSRDAGTHIIKAERNAGT
ncbi:GL20230 [Drosophila persimilis]|uniref:GL20230 n=1 Tax=Drosophila persimilis TaxID=7234 RepID=B4GXP6_DROPE|nr:SUMO-conjugating enzyme UBC9 [Drosophila persimilis]EDW27523.1 GL20230 [Drosophila persimilis]